MFLNLTRDAYQDMQFFEFSCNNGEVSLRYEATNEARNNFIFKAVYPKQNNELWSTCSQ